MNKAEQSSKQPDPAWEHLKQLSIELSAHWPPDVSVADAINDMRSDGQAESYQVSEQEMKDFWARLDELAAQISEHSSAPIDAVKIVREGRREL